MASRLIAGCGYVGKRVAQQWLAAGDTVFAFTRSPAKSLELETVGIKPILWDWLGDLPPQRSEPWELLSKTVHSGALSTILVAVSHAAVAGLPPEQTHVLGLSKLWEMLRDLEPRGEMIRAIRWIYLSTTGVFGCTAPGEWVDEQSGVDPQRSGSIAAWEGEKWIQNALAPGAGVSLRPAGIYGPGRIPNWQSIRDQVPMQADPSSYLNLIHVDDLASIVFRVAALDGMAPLYCVSDTCPVQRGDYYRFIADLGGWPEPVYVDNAMRAAGVSMARSDGNKRIRSQKIQRDLSYAFRYPTYREGLSELLAGVVGRTE